MRPGARWSECSPRGKLWQTLTPYFEKQNIHFYGNRRGFHMVEFSGSHHPDPQHPPGREDAPKEHGVDERFRFEKRIP